MTDAPIVWMNQAGQPPNTLRACVGALQRQVATRAGGADAEPERDDRRRLADVLAGVVHELEALCPYESKRTAS